ncbi:MAG: translational GTPase TypA [Planctomycetota bacterium]|nr:translational GTPase TypA [Planctomycetota bacterium]
MYREDIRNIVIIAHVDHGKTTLVDCLLRQSGQFREAELKGEQILDSNDLERERGITILAKNIALPHQGKKINIIDTPGHADFGGEVERVLTMADGAVLLVDAAEGPMPQTRFVLKKALDVGIRPIVVINKIDKPDARPAAALDEALELILELGGDEVFDQVSYLFASSKEGFATEDFENPGNDMLPLLDLIVEKVPPPEIDDQNEFQMVITSIDWSEFVGRIAVGRIQSGTIAPGRSVSSVKQDQIVTGRVGQGFVVENRGRVEVDVATAGDVVALVGMESIDIGDTICISENPVGLPRLTVDEPPLEMMFTINSSPFAGREGKYVTGRQVRERLQRELESNVALRVNFDEKGDAFPVAGRGVLHLAVLIETMRREGYELSVGKPRVITRVVEGKKEEPFESLVVEVPSDKVGPVMELVGQRRGELIEMSPREGYTQLNFSIPARGLIGLRTRLLNTTQGTAMITHRFEGYRPLEGEIPQRKNGMLISNVGGKVTAYAVDGLQDRAVMFIAPGDEVYEGMIVGEHVRENDLPVNPTREKKLTNVRAAGSDENILLKPPRRMSLEEALEYIESDELVEITPSDIRIRKALLRENDRKRFARAAAVQAARD